MFIANFVVVKEVEPMWGANQTNPEQPSTYPKSQQTNTSTLSNQLQYSTLLQTWLTFLKKQSTSKPTSPASSRPSAASSSVGSLHSSSSRSASPARWWASLSLFLQDKKENTTSFKWFLWSKMIQKTWTCDFLRRFGMTSVLLTSTKSLETTN